MGTMKDGIEERRLKDGTSVFWIKYDGPRRPDGRRNILWKRAEGTTLRDAKKERRALMKAVDDGSHIDRSGATINDILDDYFASIALRCTAKTVEGERERAKNLRRDIGAVRAQKLAKRDVEATYARLSKRLSAAGVRKIHRVLKAALKEAKSNGVIARNVCEDVKLPAAEKTQRDHAKAKTLTIDKRDAVLAALAGTDGEHRPSKWYPLARLAACTGMRRGEMLALRWADIDLDGGWVHVRRIVSHTKESGTVIEERAKTKGSVRDVAIDAETVTWLRELWSDHAQLLFKVGRQIGQGDLLFYPTLGQPTKPWNPDFASNSFIKHVTARGFAGVGLHSFRHSYAGRLIEAGAPVTAVAKQLGHASPKMTLDVYGEASPEAQQSVAKLLGETFKK